MRNPYPTLPFTSPSGPLTFNGAIEWEELPSLADSLADRLVVLGTRNRDAISAARARAAAFERAAAVGVPWDSTRPVAFDPSPQTQPQPFRETLQGLATREVTEPDVFRHFFGAPRPAG